MKFFTIAFLLFDLIFSNANRTLKDEAEEFLRSYYSNRYELRFEKFAIPADVKNKVEKSAGQRFHNDFVYVWKIFDGEKNISTAILDNVNGKSLPITFLVILDNDGKVITSEIIKYRESYGGQVTEENWLKQFKGRDENSSFQIGKEINSISGATISVNSVTRGIKKLVLLYKEVKNIL
ncbi:MAG: FMN-binding protein [Ignavibacteriales bacterium]|nr:FMN-binding protein [Ignavibacteriales bacterium]